MTITPKLNEATWVLMAFDQVRMIVSETDYGASSTRLIEPGFRSRAVITVRLQSFEVRVG